MKVRRAAIFAATATLMLLGASASCGGRSGAAEETDAAADADAASSVEASSLDAGPRCDLTAPFGATRPVIGLPQRARPEYLRSFTLTEDELDVLVDTGDEILEVSRASVDAPFGDVVAHPELDVPEAGDLLLSSGNAAVISYDGLGAAMGGLASSANESAILRGTRSARGAPFTMGTLTTWNQFTFVDTLFLVPSSEGAVYGTTNGAIFRQSPSRGLEQLLTQLATPAPRFPAVNRAETELYFRQETIVRVTRSDINQLWSQPEPVVELTGDPDRFVAWLSPDGCRAYLASSTGSEVLVTQRGWPGMPLPLPLPQDAGLDATPGVGKCTTWVDHTNVAEVQLTWDLTVEKNPDRCSIIKAGALVTWNGNFSIHPLEAQGGDLPNPITNGITTPDGGPLVITVPFPTPGTFGYDCVNHPSRMYGAVKVVP